MRVPLRMSPAWSRAAKTRASSKRCGQPRDARRFAISASARAHPAGRCKEPRSSPTLAALGGAPSNCASLVRPEPLEPIRSQVGAAHRVLDVPMPEVVLNRPGVVALVGELEAAGVAEHVRVDRKAEPRGSTRARDDLTNGRIG